MLSNYARNKIVEQLDRTIFTASAFTVDTPDQDDVWLTIAFKDNPEYEMRVQKTRAGWGEDQGDNSMVDVVQCPSGLFKQGTGFFKFESDAQLLEIIKRSLLQWTTTLQNELAANDALQKKRDQWESKLLKDVEEKISGAEHFTNEEAIKVRYRLDRLEADYETLKKAQAVSESEIEALKKKIEELKESIGKMPKKTWTRALLRRLGDVAFKVATTEKGQKFLMEQGEQLVYYVDAASKHLLSGSA